MSNVGYATLSVIPSARGFGTKLISDTKGESAAAGKSIGAMVGSGIVLGVGAAVVAAGGLYQVGQIFDDVTDTIRVGTGATGDALDGLVKSAKNVGSQVPAEFADVGTVVADLNTRLGLTGPVLEDVSKKFLEAGRITKEALDVQKVTGAFSAFKIEGAATSGALDDLFQVSQATGVGMNALASQMAKNGTITSQLGFGFTETASLLGVLDKAGVNSNAVMASMQAGLVKLAAEGEAPADAFKRVSGELSGFIAKGDDAAALDLAGKVFGTRGAGQFVSALKSGKINLDDLTGSAGLSGDTILKAGEDTKDFREQWQLFKNNVLVKIEPLATRVFAAISDGMAYVVDVGLPALSGLGDTLTGTVIPALQSFGAFLQENSTTITVIAGVIATLFLPHLIALGVQSLIAGAKSLAGWVMTQAGAIGAAATHSVAILGMVGGWVLLGVQSLLQAGRMAAAWFIALGPIGWVIAAVVAVVAVVVANWDTIVAWTSKAWTAVVGWVSSAWEKIKGWVMAGVTFVVNLVKAYFNLYVSIIRGALNGALAVVKFVWNAIRAAVGFYLNLVKSVVSAGISFVKRAIEGLASIPGRVRGFFGSMLTAVNDRIGSVVRTVKGLPGKVVSALSNFGSLLREKGAALIQGLIDGITSKIRAVTGAVRGIADKIRGFFPGSPVKEGPLVSWNNGGAGKRLGSMLVDGLDSSRAGVASASHRLSSEVGLVNTPSMPPLDKAAIGQELAGSSTAERSVRIRGTLDLGNGLRGFVDGVLEDEAAGAGRGY